MCTKTVLECVQNCARMCTKMCQNVYKTVLECVQNCAGMCAKTVPEKYTYTPSASCKARECCGIHQRFGSPQCQPLQAHLRKELPHHLLFISCDMATSSAAKQIVQLCWRMLRRRLSVLPPATVGRSDDCTSTFWSNPPAVLLPRAKIQLSSSNRHATHWLN